MRQNMTLSTNLAGTRSSFWEEFFSDARTFSLTETEPSLRLNSVQSGNCSRKSQSSLWSIQRATFKQLLLPLGLTGCATEHYWLLLQCPTNDINTYTNLPNTNTNTPYTKTRGCNGIINFMVLVDIRWFQMINM